MNIDEVFALFPHECKEQMIKQCIILLSTWEKKSKRMEECVSKVIDLGIKIDYCSKLVYWPKVMIKYCKKHKDCIYLMLRHMVEYQKETDRAQKLLLKEYGKDQLIKIIKSEHYYANTFRCRWYIVTEFIKSLECNWSKQNHWKYGIAMKKRIELCHMIYKIDLKKI